MACCLKAMSGFTLLQPSLLDEGITKGKTLLEKVTRKKSFERALEQCSREGGMKRCLSAFDLTCFGIGAIIGAGIFVLTGVAARLRAGPAVVLSYIIAGVACVFSALGYAEFAARVPSSGSAYSYSYLTVGELVAWIIGWDLTLEYLISSSSVARGWSGYLRALLEGLGATVPDWLTSIQISEGWGEGAVTLDPLAAVSVLLLTAVLLIGIKESSVATTVIVVIKLLVVLFVIVVGSQWANVDNWRPFAPFGFKGVSSGASIIFFAYLGFDMVVNVAEEAKNPQRDIPIGVLCSLAVSTVLYIAVATVITLMVPYTQIDLHAPLATAFGEHAGWKWAQVLIAFGSFCGLTSAELTGLMAQPRLYYAMAQDGLLPPWFGRIHPATSTPVNATIVTGVAAAVLAFCLDIEILADMSSIGTLLAFTLVSACVLTMRYQNSDNGFVVSPKLERFLVPNRAIDLRNPIKWVLLIVFLALLTSICVVKEANIAFSILFGLCTLAASSAFAFFEAVNVPASFKCPGMPAVPILAIYFNVYMMTNLPWATWVRLVVWLLLGLLVYFTYGIKHSCLASSAHHARKAEMVEMVAEQADHNATDEVAIADDVADVGEDDTARLSDSYAEGTTSMYAEGAAVIVDDHAQIE